MVDALKKAGENTLFNEIFEEQLFLTLPGLTKEVKEICQEIGIADICSEEVVEEEVEEAISVHHLKSLKKEMESKWKCRNLINTDMRKSQKFITTLNLEACCIGIRILTYMIKCAGNMRRLYVGREECIMCALESGVHGPNHHETQAHMEICGGYEHLKQGRDLYKFEDKISYFQDALKLREETEIRKRKKSTRNKK